MLSQFISPHTGEVFEASKTGIKSAGYNAQSLCVKTGKVFEDAVKSNACISSAQQKGKTLRYKYCLNFASFDASLN